MNTRLKIYAALDVWDTTVRHKHDRLPPTDIIVIKLSPSNSISSIWHCRYYQAKQHCLSKDTV
jgi:hypothetical protein